MASWVTRPTDPNFHLFLDAEGEMLGAAMFSGRDWGAIAEDGRLLSRHSTAAAAKAAVEAYRQVLRH